MKLKSFFVIGCLLFNLFSIRSFANKVYHVNDFDYSKTLETYKKETNTYIAEIDCSYNNTEKKFLWRLANSFNITLVYHDYEILELSFSIWDIARYDDIMNEMCILKNIPNSKIVLFLKNFERTSFNGKEFDKNLLLEKLNSIAEFWSNDSESKKDFLVFVCG